MKTLTLFTALALGISSSLSHAASFQRLGDLPGAAYSYATGLSDDGSVVVGNSFFNNVDHAWRWTSTEGIQPLETFPSEGSLSFAAKVSADGRVIGGHGFSRNGIEAMRWEAGVTAPLGDLPGGPFQSDVRAVSGDGSVLVGYGYNASGNPQAFRWTAGTGLVPLQPVPGAPFPGDPAGVSEDGLVVVGGGPSANGLEAFRWENGVTEGLGDLPGGAFQSGAAGVSADGAVVVGVSFSANGVDAFRWTRAGGMQALLDFSGILTDNIAVGVSGDGSIVVGISSEAVNQRAFIWDASHGIRKLQTVLEDDLGLASQLSGWTLTHSAAISKNGRFIAGYGTNPTGHIEGWLVDLGPAFPAENGVFKQWDKVIGGTGDDFLFDLRLTSDGGFIAGGSSNSPAGPGKAAAYGGFDYWVVKFDAAANVQWERTFGGDDFDRLYTALPLRDGGYLLAGYSASSATGNKTLPSFGGTDIWLIRLDSNGNRLWDREYGGSANEEVGFGGAVIETSDGGFLVAGESRSPANTGNKTSPLHYGADVWVLKLDNTGLKQWEQTYVYSSGGTAGGGYGSFVHETPDAFFVAGDNGSAAAAFTAWSARVDKTTGVLLTQNSYGSPIGRLTGVPLADGGYWLSGTYETASPNFWLTRVDALGNAITSRSIGGNGHDTPYSLAALHDGSFLAGGESYSQPSGDRTAPNFGSDDYWLVNFDDQGNVIWDQAFGGTGYDLMMAVRPTPDGGILLGGYSDSDALPEGGKSVGSLGGLDWWIIKLGSPCDAITPPAIVEISIPPNSQSPECRPSYDQVWQVAAPPYPLDVNSGIGVIVNPVIIGGNNNHDFSIHQGGSAPYDSPYVPHRDSSTVTYRFDQPAIVSGVEIVQHVFGITRVEGLSGNSLNTMTTLGAVFGPSGDVIDGFVVPGEAQSQVFTFNNTSTAGTYFQLVVLKTPHVWAFANYRIFPLDQNGNRISLATGSEQITPQITWPAPAAIVYGTALSGVQLNASASVPGQFLYSPPAGTVLDAGNGQELFVLFTPTDTANYSDATTSVSINVLKAPTAMALVSSANPSQLGQAVSVTATITPSGASGSVRFVEGSFTLATIPLSQGQASFTTSALALGVHSIQAIYDGDANYDGSSATIAQTVKQTITVGVRLSDSTGNPLSGGKAQYYSGGWHDIGLTGIDGMVSVELLPGSYNFSVDYVFGRATKVQNIGTNPTVVFQTQRATTRLIDSAGNPLAGGNAQYYAGGWHDFGLTGSDGTVSVELLPGSYNFSVDYAFDRVTKVQNIGANPTVVFQTQLAITRLIDSAGNPLVGGRTQYYAGGWRDIGLTGPDGTVSVELLPGSYNFSVDYAFGRMTKVQNIGADPTVVFQTQRAVTRLVDSTGNPLAGGRTQYYTGGWRDIGLTGPDGTVSVELVPGSYNFSVDYAFGRMTKVQSIGANPTVVFQTQRAVTRLVDSTGNPLAGGRTQYYTGGWRDIGLTGPDGTVSVELVPGSYNFSVDYAFGRVTKVQNIGTDPTVVFQTGRVHSASGTCTQYYGSGWRTFVNNMELLPITWNFRFNDGTGNTPSTVAAGTVTNIH